MKATKVLSALVIGMMIVSSIPLFASAQAANDTLVIALQQDMLSMNPWDPDTNDVWKSNQIGWCFEGLMAYNPDYELYPVLAAESATGPNGADAWINSNGTQVSVNIREGVTFHDGVEMTSKDVVFSYQTLVWGLFQTQVKTPLRHPVGTTFERYDGGTTRIGVEANGTYRVDFFLAKPYAMFWYLTMAVPIMPEHIWNGTAYDHVLNYDDDTAPITNDCEITWDYGYGADESEIDATIGTGPLMLESWTKEQGCVITAYEGYWDRDGTTNWAGTEYPNYPQHVTTIKFKIYTQLDVAIMALQNGDVHHLPWSLTPGYYNLLKTDPNIGIEQNKDQGFFYMSFNFRKDGIDDVNFRRAVSYCVDKQYIVDRLMGGYGIQGSVPISVTNQLYVNDTVPAWIAGGDLAAAEALLDANDYTDKDGDGWRDMPDGSPLKYNILTPPKDYDPIRADAGIMIEKNLKSIGLNIAAVPTSFDTIVSAAYVSLDFDMYILGWTVGSFPESYLADFFHSDYDVAVDPSGSNAAGYHNASVDAMLDEMDVTMDTEDRVQLIKDICGATMMDVPYDTLYYRTNIEAYRNDIWSGWVPAFGTIYNGFSIFNLAPPTDGGGGGGGGSGGSATLSGIESKINMPSMAGAGQIISGSILAVDLLDNSGVQTTQPSSGATVAIETTYGQFVNTTTDANGLASFTLRVPYQKINNFRVDVNVSHSGAWTNVNKTVGVKFTNHIAQLSLSTEDGVIAPGATTDVIALVTDENGDPMAGIEVSVDTALMFGSVDDDTKATDATGIATFVYTAPPVTMLPNTHRFEQFKASIMPPETIVPEIQSASLIIGISSDLYDWQNIDITDVTEYILDNDNGTAFADNTTITLSLTDQDEAIVADQYVTMSLSEGNTVIDADALMKKTNATGAVTFNLTVDSAYTGAGTVVATFNTSKGYSTKDSVAIYIRNDPTFTADMYHLNITSSRDMIWNTNTTENVTTIDATLTDAAWAPVEGVDLYMGAYSDLIEASAESLVTDANGTASFNITCIANGSADIPVVFGIYDSIGIFEGYNLKVNQTVEQTTATIMVSNEHKWTSLENSRYWHILANVPADNASVKKWNAGVWTDLVEGTNYNINLATGNISYITTLATGDKVSVWYNYTKPIANESVVTNALGGETYALLDHTKILNATIYKNDSVGAWTKLAWTTDYTIDNATGNVTFVAALTTDDDIFAYYNYTTAVANETVFAGPAVAGETGPWTLAHPPVIDPRIFKNDVEMAPAGYTIVLATGELNLVTPLVAGDNINATYNYTVNTANHRLDVASVSSYYIDSNTFADAIPGYSIVGVTLTDASGNPLAGKNITAISWGSDVTIEDPYAVTDISGMAAFNISSATDMGTSVEVYFNVNDTAGVAESVILYNAEYKPGYAADIDFAGIADHDSTMDITATVYDAAGNPAVGVPCQFFIPPTAEGRPGVFEGGDSWEWWEYDFYDVDGNDGEDGLIDLNDMGWYAGYLGSWYENNATVTDANGQLTATIDTPSFIADSLIPLQFGVGGTGVAAAFNYSANNFWVEYSGPYDPSDPDSVPPLTDNLLWGPYYWEQATFTMIDQAILFRAPMATLTEITMDQPFLSGADNATTVSLTFQDMAGALDAVTVNFGEGTAKPTILDEAETSAAGVYTYDYTAPGGFDAGIGFTSVVTDSGYAKFPFNFYLPYLAAGTDAQTLVVSIEAAENVVAIGDNITLDVTVMDEYGRLVAGVSIVSGDESDTTDAAGVAQLIIPTEGQTDAGLFELPVNATKGTLITKESASVILEAAEVEVVMVDVIVGPVQDTDDEPISGALVTISLGTRQATNYTGTTNATGYATVSVPATFLGQSVTITITKDGYETVSYTTTLNADGTFAAAPPAFDLIEEEGGLNMMLIAVIVIVVVVVIVVVLVVLPKMKGGKGAEPAEKKPEPAEEPEETPEPAEEPAAPEEPKPEQ